MTEYVTPTITSVLKKYQNSAPKSLQGPGHTLAVAAAAAAAAAASGVNCPLDATIAGNGISDLVAVAQTSLTNGKIQGQGQGQGQVVPPAVALIKKEILSSPEPHDMLDTQNAAVQQSNPSVVVATGVGSSAAPGVAPPPAPPPQIYPPPPPELSQPILSVADSGSGELYETRLEGKTIGCFSLGGEMRLCLPQFLNNVLNDFSLEQINRIFDELGIYCSQCTPDQLVEFKAAKILPSDVKASGLITRTDAERLCAALLHRSDRNSYIPVENLAKGALSFHVYHKCFGKCEGICTPDMYSYQKPTCIKCLECDGWFSPQKFVGHVHRKFENRTCHWGFDSRNWHDYLHVALDVENREKYQRILDQLKEVELKETHKAQLDQKKRK
ncbi:ski oncogene-like, partial [Scaptodrosophila lebanonensis]